MHPREKIVWYAPTWSTAPKLWWALKKFILSPGPLLRITAVSAVCIGAILSGLKLAFPGIVFPNLWLIPLQLMLLVGVMVLQTYLLSIFKARVVVNRKKIVIQHGQSATIIKSEWLTDVKLAVHDNDRQRIRFCYDKKGRAKFKSIGLSADCDLGLLEELLPVEITAKDFRRQAPSAASAHG